jgi:beta-lactamase regulating signal transducer with metallopeptidase domain
VIDHLWQSTLFAVVIALMMPLFARQSAGLRFWLWFAASVKFLFPFSLLIWLGGFLPALPERAPLLVVKSLVLPPVLIAPPAELMPATQFLWVLWAAGALFLGARWLARWWSLRAALKDAPDLGVDAPVPVKAVASFLEPGLVGIFRPVIVMPRGIAEALSAGEMRAVLAHEISHLSRRDNLWASVQMLVEMLFWFHPLVWWIGAKLVTERERACDETVLDTGNAPRTYAESILKICRFHLQPSLTCVSGVSGGNLTARVGAIMVHRRSADADGARILLLGSLGLTAVLLPLLAGAPGSAPVSQLARQVASSMLYAPGLLALPQMKFVTPSAPHVEPPVIRVAEAPPAPPPAEGALAAEVIIAPVVERTASVIATKVSAAPPQSGGNEVFCRKPQHLKGSRLLGPSVCLKVSEWEALRAEGRDITPDGRATMAVAAPVVERPRDVIATKVSAALPPLASTEPVAAETQDDRVVCRQPQRLLGSRLFGRSVCLKASAWADLKAQGRDIGPDGRTMTMSTSERVRSLYPPACPASTPGGGISTTAGMPRGVCL